MAQTCMKMLAYFYSASKVQSLFNDLSTFKESQCPHYHRRQLSCKFFKV